MGGAEQCNMALALALRPCLLSALLTLVLKRPRKVRRSESTGYDVEGAALHQAVSAEDWQA